MRERQNPTGSSTILCVDDDVYLTDLLTYALTREGYVVKVADSAAAALKAIDLDVPGAAIVDIGLPDATGVALCAQLRTNHGIPVIMLTAVTDVQDMVQAFARGADDFVSKPFNMQVLMLRLAAVLRRANPPARIEDKSQRIRRLGPGWFDPLQNLVKSEHTSVRLTRTEGKILHFLIANEQHVFSADHIIERIWGYDTDTDASVVKTHIRHLREKLTQTLGPVEIIHTVPGRGYTLRSGRVLALVDPPRGSAPQMDAS